MAEVVCERGAANVSVAHVVGRSGMSRRTFYELFEDREDCFVAAFQEGIRRAWTRIEPAYSAGGGWRERTRAALLALLGFLDEEPAIGRLLVVETLAAGPTVLEHRSRVVAQLVQAIREGEQESRSGVQIPPLTAEGIVGAVLAIIHNQIVDRDEQPLTGLVNPLMAMIVLPYLGSGAVRRELTRPQPTVQPSNKTSASNPLAGLGMRLTYRTVRVLLAVGAHPDCSNRRIAEIADIPDPGQASKLLTRLEHVGLIERTNSSHLHNSWRLTQKGDTVKQAITTHSQVH